ncbi:LytR C-terminal domain-containing protein [Corynebacterium dentalis]|uniref:LytR C-terminal domain-containing protein n=1 Tax=Corynebacterium dentalis TaxID=2014528 RepID=UPI00289F501C|nr:LytR C-terminal domain-containing protein [Corynebacterium dentalis]
MTDSNRPRHALDDDSFDEAFAFDDTPENYDDQDPAAAGAPSSKVPMRGLGMILLAVGIVLVGWGAFSLAGGDDDSNEQNAASTESVTEQAQQPSQTQQSAAPSQSPEQNPSETQSQAPAAPGAGVGNEGAAEGQVNKADQQITVLNNSPIQGLAGDTAKTLRDKQWGKTSFGNLPDTEGAFPKSVVLYPGNDANARAAAEQVAADLRIEAQARTPEIDGRLAAADMLEGEGPAAVVVVTTNDMPR